MSIRINISGNKLDPLINTDRLLGLATFNKERCSVWSRSRCATLFKVGLNLPTEIIWLCIDYDSPMSHEWSANNVGFKTKNAPISVIEHSVRLSASASSRACIELAERIHPCLPTNVTLSDTSKGRRDWIYHWGGGVDQWLCAFGKETFDCAPKKWVVAFHLPLWGVEVEVGRNTPIFKIGITRRPNDLKVKNRERLQKRMQTKDQARHRRRYTSTRYGLMYEIDRSRVSLNLKTRCNAILGSAQHRDRQDRHWEFPIIARQVNDSTVDIFVLTHLDEQFGTLTFQILPPISSSSSKNNATSNQWSKAMTICIDKCEIPQLDQRYVPFVALRFPNISATLVSFINGV
jgi:hypothetical protein